MREPPKLSDAAIVAALREHYHISVAALAFLPLGNDSSTWVYRVGAADGAAYFLKLRRGSGFRLASLAVPRFLQDHGLPHLVAPIPTTAQALWVSLGDFALILYPYIEGQVGGRVGLSDQQWRAFGALVGQFHSIAPPPELAAIMPRETFTPNGRSTIDALEAAVAANVFANAAEHELAAFWRARRDEIRVVVERADALGRALSQKAPPLVICHADMHPWNVLLGGDDFWLIDWDEVRLAPKERDLMFAVGGIGGAATSPHTAECFLQGYGADAIDMEALAYYRYAWAVSDMAADGEQVFFLPDFGEQTRLEGARDFAALFEPGCIVAIARASDAEAA